MRAVGSTRRARLDRLLFLGPATVLLLLFHVLPVVVDLLIALTDMGRNLQVSRFTKENVERIFGGDRRLARIVTNTRIYVVSKLAIFNEGYGPLLALVTT